MSAEFTKEQIAAFQDAFEVSQSENRDFPPMTFFKMRITIMTATLCVTIKISK